MFSILIVTWNNLKHLALCLDSIIKHSEYNHEILIHIQEKHQPTIDYLINFQQVSDLKVRYTTSDTNIGISKAVNILAEMANNEYICHMDDDMYVLPYWDDDLWNAIGYFYTDVWMSSLMIEPFGENVSCLNTQKYGTNIDNFNRELLIRDHLKGDILNISDKTYGSYQDCSTTFIRNNQNNPWVLTKSLWDKMGGANEKYFAPGFEEGLAYRAYRAGVKDFLVSSTSTVFHFQSVSMNRLPNSAELAAQRDRNFLLETEMTTKEFIKTIVRRGERF